MLYLPYISSFKQESIKLMQIHKMHSSLWSLMGRSTWWFNQMDITTLPAEDLVLGSVIQTQCSYTHTLSWFLLHRCENIKLKNLKQIDWLNCEYHGSTNSHIDGQFESYGSTQLVRQILYHHSLNGKKVRKKPSPMQVAKNLKGM